jgi:hypothetical protein
MIAVASTCVLWFRDHSVYEGVVKEIKADAQS